MPSANHQPASSPGVGKVVDVVGDLVAMAEEGRFDVIAHGCNCFCTMGAGIARTIKNRFPEAWEADRLTAYGNRSKLGTCTQAVCPRITGNITVVNAYTQFDFGRQHVSVDYDAVTSCMRWIKRHHHGTRIGLPRIGSGLAGGDWERLRHIIVNELEGENLTLVEFVG